MATSAAESERPLASVAQPLLEPLPAPPPSARTPAASLPNHPVAQGWRAVIPEAWLEWGRAWHLAVWERAWPVAVSGRACLVTA